MNAMLIKMELMEHHQVGFAGFVLGRGGGWIVVRVCVQGVRRCMIFVCFEILWSGGVTCLASFSTEVEGERG